MSTRTNLKKLVLHRETLRIIGRTELGGVNGGGGTRECTVTIETKQCPRGRLQDHLDVNDTVYHPPGNPPAQNDTVYHGGGRIVAI